MTQDIDDLLLEGETVIWRGAPDFSRAKVKPTSRGAARLQHLAWSIGLIAATISTVLIGQNWLSEGFLSLLLAFIAVVMGIAAVIVTGTLLFQSGHIQWGASFGDPQARYALTSKRLIVQSDATRRASIMPAGIGSLRLEPNGEVFDLCVVGGAGEDDFTYLQAIPDGPAVERLILEILSHPTPDAPQ